MQGLRVNILIKNPYFPPTSKTLYKVFPCLPWHIGVTGPILWQVRLFSARYGLRLLKIHNHHSVLGEILAYVSAYLFPVPCYYFNAYLSTPKGENGQNNNHMENSDDFSA